MTQTTNPQSPLKLYKFCPKCGGDFTHRGGNHLRCEACEYSYFVNQAPTAGLVIFDEAGREAQVRAVQGHLAVGRRFCGSGRIT